MSKVSLLKVSSFTARMLYTSYRYILWTIKGEERIRCGEIERDE